MYCTSSGSQDVTEGMRGLFAPEYADAVADNGFRGDFVQVINRRYSEDDRLFEGRTFPLLNNQIISILS